MPPCRFICFCCLFCLPSLQQISQAKNYHCHGQFGTLNEVSLGLLQLITQDRSLVLLGVVANPNSWQGEVSQPELIILMSLGYPGALTAFVVLSQPPLGPLETCDLTPIHIFSQTFPELHRGEFSDRPVWLLRVATSACASIALGILACSILLERWEWSPGL